MLIKKSIISLLNNPLKCVCSKLNLSKRQRLLVLSRRSYSSSSKKIPEYDTPIENIRNFSIIAHVDHGKSTLADRILEMTGAIKKNSGEQVLDKLQVEKERGITVKAQTASLKYAYKGKEYMLNLIDTPGHVDFASEVQRSLIACQGVILVVDANDGVQAQTVANFFLAFGRDLVIIPAINKIDLKNANPERVMSQLEMLFDIPRETVFKISAKLGTGVEELLDAVVEKIPPPSADKTQALRALIFDSWFVPYKGAIALTYIKDGCLSVGDQVVSVHSGKNYEVKSLSMLRPEEEIVSKLYAGQVGCMTCNMKSAAEACIGDTMHLKDQPVEALPGFEPPKAMVFAGIYPMDQTQHVSMRKAIDNLMLNDCSVTVSPESSPALGQGWRLGFLGLLHMEVFVQRLEQEFDAEPIVTSPGVTYMATITGAKNITKYQGASFYFNNPAHYPDESCVEEFFEPMVKGTIVTPDEYIGPVIGLCMDRRGTEESTQSINNGRTMMQFELPLNEIIVDFHDELKSMTSGYASFDYEDYGYKSTSLAKLDVMLNGLLVQELCTVVHKTKAKDAAKRLAHKLSEIIPRQQFSIAIQVVNGAKVLSRENLKPYRKDVTQKLKSGGDMQRRRKLLEQQAEGKRKLKMVGSIALPRETFINILKK